MPLSVMRATSEIQLQAIARRIFPFFMSSCQLFLSLSTHQDTIWHGRGELYAFPDLGQVDLQEPVADELDCETHHRLPLKSTEEFLRKLLHLAAQGLPDHTAPAGFEGAEHVYLFIGGGGCQPDGWGSGCREICGYVGHMNDFLSDAISVGGRAGHNTFFDIRKNAKLWRISVNG